MQNQRQIYKKAAKIKGGEPCFLETKSTKKPKKKSMTKSNAKSKTNS